jgi:hypothetical protein
MFTSPEIYYGIGAIAFLITGIKAYGRFEKSLERKAIKIDQLEDASRRHEIIVEKIFNKLDNLQEDVTQIRLDLKDKMNR